MPALINLKDNRLTFDIPPELDKDGSPKPGTSRTIHLGAAMDDKTAEANRSKPHIEKAWQPRQELSADEKKRLLDSSTGKSIAALVEQGRLRWV